MSARTVTYTSTQTCPGSPTPTPCPAGDYIYDQVNQFTSVASSLYLMVPTSKWHISGTLFKTHNTGSTAAGSGSGPGFCPSTEIGFVLTGHIMTGPAAELGHGSKVTACFDTDTGPSTTGSFTTDVAAETGGNTSMTITTASEDAAASSIAFT